MEEGIPRPRSPRRVLHQGMGTKVSRDVRKSGSRVHKCHRITRAKDSNDSLLVDELDQGPAIPWGRSGSRWGPQLGQATYKNRQRLYLSEQTDGSVPNTLVIENCEVVKRRVAATEHISQFNEEARSPFIKKYKTIIHPREGCVNRIRELTQNSKIVGTHSDSPDVLIWDIEAQPNRHVVLGAANSSTDLLLIVHKDNAEFPLAMCPTDPFVLSGGKDKSVGLWSIQDQISTLASESTPAKSPGSGGTNTNLASKGDDSCLILWDSRSSSTPVVKSADNTINRFDRRNLTSGGVGSPVYIQIYNNNGFLNKNIGESSESNGDQRCSIFGSKSNPAFICHQRQDRLLVSWLLASISTSYLPQLIGCSSSQQFFQPELQSYSELQSHSESCQSCSHTGRNPF
ncbi:hypothetical protein UlMin_020206 [Ulmus minor]